MVSTLTLNCQRRRRSSRTPYAKTKKYEK